MIELPQDPESVAQRELRSLDLGDRIADVCRGCGHHILASCEKRLDWLHIGGTITCSHCKITKTREKP